MLQVLDIKIDYRDALVDFSYDAGIRDESQVVEKTPRQRKELKTPIDSWFSILRENIVELVYIQRPFFKTDLYSGWLSIKA